MRDSLRGPWVRAGAVAAVLLLLAAVLSPLWAEYDRPVAATELPAEAQRFLDEHFAGQRIAFAKTEVDYFVRTYEVILADGAKVAFSRRGRWLKVESPRHTVPEAVVPEAIRAYVAENFPGDAILEIEHDGRRYEVELRSSVELEFDDRTFRLTDYDN